MTRSLTTRGPLTARAARIIAKQLVIWLNDPGEKKRTAERVGKFIAEFNQIGGRIGPREESVRRVIGILLALRLNGMLSRCTYAPELVPSPTGTFGMEWKSNQTFSRYVFPVLRLLEFGYLNRILRCRWCGLRWFYRRAENVRFCSDGCRLKAFESTSARKRKKKAYMKRKMREYRALEKDRKAASLRAFQEEREHVGLQTR